MQASSLSSWNKFVPFCGLSVSDRQSIAASRIRSAESYLRFLLDHDPLRITEITWLLGKRVPARSEGALRVTRQAKRFADELVRQPLVMDARKIDGLLDTHVVVDHVGDDAEHCID